MYSPLGKNPIEKMLAAVLMLIALATFLAPSAYAHAKLIRSQPSDGETLEQSPKAVQLTFSERVQQTAINEVAVTDEGGNRVDKKMSAVSEDGKKIFAVLEELASGTYAVEWKALSADQHLMKGKFIFTVAPHNKRSAANSQ
jgi:methionine-rich copper-binding protein CopC